MDFLNYWDTRIDANERFFNNYPHIANFAFIECQELWDRMSADYAALLARHNALRDAVAWERECGTVSFTDLWFDEWNRTEDQSKSAMQELRFTRRAARAEVDRLLQEPPC